MTTKVTLRQKKISKGRKSLYLDFYPPIPHPETGEPTRREFLGLYIFEKPKTEEQIEEENKIEEEEKARNTIVYSSKWFGNFTEEEIQYLDEYYDKLNVDENTKNMDYVDTAKKMAEDDIVLQF